MEELDRLEAWCDAMLNIMEDTLSHKYMTKRRREMTKAEMMGIEKVRGQIRRRRHEIESGAII